jgi:diacylglycerol kinase (ATP)
MSDFSIRHRLRSFGYAFQGAKTLLLTQHNAWIHAVATAGVLVAAIVCRVSKVEWALLVFAIALVWLAEAMNTAIEFLADEVSEEKRERIGKAKDTAAFGVLVCAIAAAIIGSIVFLPHVILIK